MPNTKLPFRNMRPEKWQNLALLAIAVFFLMQVLMDVFWKNLCGHLGIDYCAYWSAGYLANKYGYMAAYNISLLETVQKQVFPPADALYAAGYFLTIPFPYLPIYLIPFQLLSFLGPYAGYWVWTLINLAAFIFYIRFFVKNTTGQTLPTRLLIMLLLSMPIFFNSFSGQVNIWLGIFVGEFIRNLLSNKPFRAGIWLGGLMLKPQFLILIGIFLLLQRSTKALAGLITSAFLISLASLALWGWEGFLNIGQMLVGFANGRTPIGAEVMMNWRMIGLNLSHFISPWIAWGIAILGLTVTTGLAIYLSLKHYEPGSAEYSIVLLAILAATGAVTWHSHIPSAVMMYPSLLYLFFTQNRLTKKPIELWIFIPPIFHLAGLFLGGAIKAGAVPGSFTTIMYFFASISEFGLNVYLLLWCMRQLSGSFQLMKAPIRQEIA